MSRIAIYAAAFAGLLALSPSLSAAVKLNDATADGTWDCKDGAGANIGTIVLAETTYAFLGPDGKLGGYGKLYI